MGSQIHSQPLGDYKLRISNAKFGRKNVIFMRKDKPKVTK
jgi:hypothetical protein